jgi:hypothetical protein
MGLGGRNSTLSFWGAWRLPQASDTAVARQEPLTL